MLDGHVIIAEYANPHQADMAKLFLDEEDIPAYLENRLLVETDWLLSNAIGNIRLQVPEAQAERARQILAEKAKAIAEATEARLADPGKVSCLNCGRELGENESTCPSCGWSYVEENEKP